MNANDNRLEDLKYEKDLKSKDIAEDILSLEDYEWCESTVCRNCKSHYANREDSLTCPCLDEY